MSPKMVMIAFAAARPASSSITAAVRIKIAADPAVSSAARLPAPPGRLPGADPGQPGGADERDRPEQPSGRRTGLAGKRVRLISPCR